MNFTNRDSSGQQSQPTPNTGGGAARVSAAATPNPTLKHSGGGNNRRRRPDLLRGTWLILLFSVSVILVSIVYLLYVANPTTSKYVDSKRLQAVFLANGQVYFGQIKSISSKYIDLRGIFYLNNNETGTANTTDKTNLSLVKLGCELHGPFDAMIINQDQVTFWENLRDDGQVAKAVADYLKKNPDGLKCDESTTPNTSQGVGSPQSNTAPQTPARNP